MLSAFWWWLGIFPWDRPIPPFKPKPEGIDL
jgi:hypothetical protein